MVETVFSEFNVEKGASLGNIFHQDISTGITQGSPQQSLTRNLFDPSRAVPVRRARDSPPGPC